MLKSPNCPCNFYLGLVPNRAKQAVRAHSESLAELSSACKLEPKTNLRSIPCSLSAQLDGCCSWTKPPPWPRKSVCHAVHLGYTKSCIERLEQQ